MTDFNLEIIQPPDNTIDIVTSAGTYLEITNRDKILPSDFPDTYPISSTIGQLPISRVSGLYSGSGIIFSSGLDGSLTINALAQNITLLGTSGISVSQSGNLYTIYTTGTFGLSSSQIQSLLNSGVSINAISGTGNFNSLSISGTPVSVSGHSHIASSITDFNSSVSGLLPVKNILGSGYASVASSGGVFTVSVTGLQPSGNYSSSGHQHISSDITNFNSSVSGLFPITNIVGISGASVTSSGTTFTVAVTGSFGLTTSQIQSLLNSGVSISVTGGTGNFNSLSVNSVPVSTSGHSHLSSSITDFNSSVSGLIPVKNIVNSGYVVVSSSSGIFTIGVTGLQPSGNYSISGHQHTSSDIINFNSSVSGLLAPYALLNSGNFTTLLVTNVPVSLSGHLHTSSQITDFNSAVSGLLPFTGILGSGYVTLNSSNRILTIGVSGLQPSGNYSVSGHTHTASNITDFNSSTSGLLTPYAQLENAIFNNLAVDTLFTSNSPNFSVDEDGNTGIGANNPLVGVLVPNLSVAYSLSASSGTISSGLNVFNYLRLNNTGVSLSGHSHTVSDISNFGSGVSGLLLVKDILPGTNVTITSNSGIYTINSSGGGGGGSVSVSDPGSGRLLASDGTSSGIIGQSNLTFINNNLAVNGVIISNGSNLYMWSNFR